MANRQISMDTMLTALLALDRASAALVEAPGDKAFSAYLDAVKAQAQLRTALGLLEPVEIAEKQTANPVGLAA